jgi:hypothetical protein
MDRMAQGRLLRQISTMSSRAPQTPSPASPKLMRNTFAAASTRSMLSCTQKCASNRRAILVQRFLRVTATNVLSRSHTGLQRVFSYKALTTHYTNRRLLWSPRPRQITVISIQICNAVFCVPKASVFRDPCSVFRTCVPNTTSVVCVVCSVFRAEGRPPSKELQKASCPR